jgi:hypothetical protein
MKKVLLIIFAVVSAAPLYAQQSVMIKEPPPQCYEDLKATLPEAIRWDDRQMTVTSRPAVTTMSGNVEVVARIFLEYGEDKDTKERVEMCKIVVAIYSPDNRVAWNAMYSSWLFQNASLMKARIESLMKARRKKNKHDRG